MYFHLQRQWFYQYLNCSIYLHVNECATLVYVLLFKQLEVARLLPKLNQNQSSMHFPKRWSTDEQANVTNGKRFYFFFAKHPIIYIRIHVIPVQFKFTQILRSSTWRSMTSLATSGVKCESLMGYMIELSFEV